MTRPKPVLFLDVDGVINAFGGFPDERKIRLRGDRFPHTIYPTEHTKPFMHWAWKHFDVMWCTAWQNDANVIAKWAGLPPRTCVATANMGGDDWKLTGAQIFRAKDKRMVVWIEDGLFKETEAWVMAQEKFVYVHTDQYVGVTKTHAAVLADILGLSMRGWNGKL